MYKWLFFGVIAYVLPPVAHGQELLIPVLSNPLKTNAAPFAKTKSVAALPVELPFREDFSGQSPFPDTRFWADTFVFINSGFPVHPKTVGVATFDMLDQQGRLYERAQESPFQFVADHLTSHPIRLGHLTPADSVLLTFYYQPQGHGGGNPRERDSLVVEFLKTPGHHALNDQGLPVWVPDAWQTVWSTTGETLESFSNNTFPFFKRVALFITNPVFFRNDFRFRFKNYGSFAPPDQSLRSMAGNNNIWNIDYIVLDRGRSKLQTTYHDIAFAAPASSLLRRYSAMPWSHFSTNPQNHLKTNLQNTITNLGNIIYNYTYRYLILDGLGNALRTYSGGAWNIAPFTQSGYQVFQPHTSPIVISNPFPASPAAQRQFQIVHVIREGVNGDSNRENDTIVFHQSFDNYFAYDDGAPESGYGLIGRNVKGAFRFILSRPDTLRAIQFFFNRTIDQQNEFPIHIMVWSSLQPEQVLYRSAAPFAPRFSDDLNGFITYELGIPRQVSGTIFVGWEQRTDGFINLGYDANALAGENISFNVGNGWQPSIFPGALMIRPVVASAMPSGATSPASSPKQPSVFPNPLKESMLNIVMDEAILQTEQLWVEVFDMQGRLVLAREFNPVIDLGHLNNGIYLLRVTNRLEHTSQTTRIIIAR